jgi:hypothetical protein
VENDSESDFDRRRRDNEPDRAPLLKLLAIVGTLLGLLSCLILPGLLGFVLGVAVRAMASRDLAMMARGEMDKRGRKEVQTARALGTYAVAINGTVLACCGLGPLLLWLVSWAGYR